MSLEAKIEISNSSKELLKTYLIDNNIEAFDYMQKSIDSVTALVVTCTTIQTAIAIYQLVQKFNKEQPKNKIKIDYMNFRSGKCVRVDLELEEDQELEFELREIFEESKTK